jgi:hypothetical protein
MPSALESSAQRCLLGIADLRAAKPHEPAFRRGFGGVFGDMM